MKSFWTIASVAVACLLGTATLAPTAAKADVYRSYFQFVGAAKALQDICFRTASAADANRYKAALAPLGPAAERESAFEDAYVGWSRWIKQVDPLADGLQRFERSRRCAFASSFAHRGMAYAIERMPERAAALALPALNELETANVLYGPSGAAARPLSRPREPNREAIFLLVFGDVEASDDAARSAVELLEEVADREERALASRSAEDVENFDAAVRQLSARVRTLNRAFGGLVSTAGGLSHNPVIAVRTVERSLLAEREGGPPVSSRRISGLIWALSDYAVSKRVRARKLLQDLARE